jgi:hypothetical protein
MGCHLSTPDVANHCEPALDRKWRQEANVPKPAEQSWHGHLARKGHLLSSWELLSPVTSPATSPATDSPPNRRRNPSPRYDEEAKRHEAERLTLDDALDDLFSQKYLLRFAQAESASENIAMLIGLRTLLHMVPCADVKRLTRELIHNHVMDGASLKVTITPSLQQQLSAWLKASTSDDALPPPMGALSEAYQDVYHQVRFGIFPRFRRSTACREYASLHLRRLLVSSVFLDVFLDAFAGEGSTVREQVRLSQALDFYLSALKYQETYAQLVEPGCPPKPSESSKAMAGVICSKYKDTWLGLGLDSHAHELIQRQLPEASPHLFDPVLKLALNALEPVYDEWLDSDTGVNFCLEVVGLTPEWRSKPQTLPVPGSAKEDWCSNDDW